MNELTTVEIVEKLSTQMVDDPEELSKYLIRLTASLYQYGKQSLDREILYAHKWAELRETTESDGRATVLIKTAPEYKNWKEAVIVEKTVQQLIMSIKRRLKSLDNEYNA